MSSLSTQTDFGGNTQGQRGFWGRGSGAPGGLQSLAAGYSNPRPQNAPLSLCVRFKNGYQCNRIIYFKERLRYFIVGRGRRGLIEQSQNKPKRSHSYSPRGKPIVIEFRQKREIEEMIVPENVVDFMKNMNPQQLVDFLLPKYDDWHVKTSS